MGREPSIVLSGAGARRAERCEDRGVKARRGAGAWRRGSSPRQILQLHFYFKAALALYAQLYTPTGEYAVDVAQDLSQASAAAAYVGGTATATAVGAPG